MGVFINIHAGFDYLASLMNVAITCKMNTTNLTRGIAIARKYSKRAPAVAVNTAAFFIARQARVDTPVTSIGRIDNELGVIATPILSTRGKRAGLPLRSGRKSIAANLAVTAGGGAFAAVPLTWLLISARAKPGSNFNKLTADRWKLPQHPLKGHRVSEFAAIMAAAVQRMTSARHSGTSFFASAWIPVIRILEAFVAAKYRRGAAQGPSAGGRRNVSDDHGRVQPALEGATRAICVISNMIGMSGRLGELDERRNAALLAVAGPALQSAIDKEYWKTMQYVAKQELLADAPQFNTVGFRLNI